MAKRKDDELMSKLHAGGLRKKVAKTVDDAVSSGRRKKPPKALTKVVDDLRNLADQIEDRATGKTAKRKAAAKKAAATRKQKARARSTAAKKAARTRAKAG